MRPTTATLGRRYLTAKLKGMKIWLSMQPAPDLEVIGLFTADVAAEITEFALQKLGHDVPNRTPVGHFSNRSTQLARKQFYEGRAKGAEAK